MVRNFGEKRKKNNKKSRGKGSRGEKETAEVTCQDVAVYVPADQREAENGKSKHDSGRSSKPRNTYRSKRMERQREKKDHKSSRESWGYDDYEDEDDDDDGDYGGEYDEIIRTGPSRREARESREFEQMASTSISFIDLGTGHGRNGRTRTGRRGNGRRNGRYGYNAGRGSAPMNLQEVSMYDLLMMAFRSALTM